MYIFSSSEPHHMSLMLTFSNHEPKGLDQAYSLTVLKGQPRTSCNAVSPLVDGVLY